jgi:hypothetical protein
MIFFANCLERTKQFNISYFNHYVKRSIIILSFQMFYDSGFTYKEDKSPEYLLLLYVLLIYFHRILFLELLVYK